VSIVLKPVSPSDHVSRTPTSLGQRLARSVSGEEPARVDDHDDFNPPGRLSGGVSERAASHPSELATAATRAPAEAPRRLSALVTAHHVRIPRPFLLRRSPIHSSADVRRRSDGQEASPTTRRSSTKESRMPPIPAAFLRHLTRRSCPRGDRRLWEKASRSTFPPAAVTTAMNMSLAPSSTPKAGPDPACRSMLSQQIRGFQADQPLDAALPLRSERAESTIARIGYPLSLTNWSGRLTTTLPAAPSVLR
jgi:hypothetical protein